MDWTKVYVTIFSFLILHFLDVESTGLISVRLLSYENPSGTVQSGLCCGGLFIKPCPINVKQCNHFFRICIGSSNSSCDYGEKGISAGKESNYLIFDPKSQNFEYTTPFDIWEGLSYIRINVNDTDSSGRSEVVDSFKFVHNETLGTRNYTLKGHRQTESTKLQIQVRVSCSADYYGPKCDVYCKPGGLCFGHYTCDNNGNKICRPGYTGAECETQLAGGPADCNIYEGRKDFVPGLWKGTFVCENRILQNINMNVSHQSSSILANAELHLPTDSLQVQGTYTNIPGSPVALILEGKTGSGTKIQLKAVQINSTLLSGPLYIDDKNCSTTLSLYESYFTGCSFADKCVRFGKEKSQYYCCCGKGNQSAPCIPPTTTPKLTTKKATVTTRQTTVESMLSTEPTTVTTEAPSTIQTTEITTTTTQSTTSLPTTEIPTTEATAEPTSNSQTTEKTTKMTTEKTTSEQQPLETTLETMTKSEAQTTENPTTMGITSSKKPTTSEASTQQPTESPTQTEITTAKKTTVSTSPVTAVVTPTQAPSTVETTATSTVTTKVTPQTSLALTSTPTPSTTSVTPSVSTTVAPFNPSKLYTLALNIVKEEFDNAVFQGLERAWMDQNEALGLNESMISITYHGLDIYIVQEGDSHRGYEISEMKYKIFIEGVNASLIQEPSGHTIEEAMKTVFDKPVKVYYAKGSDKLFEIWKSFTINVYGPGPSDDEMESWQDAILDAYNMSCSKSMCENFTFEEIQIKMTEEFVAVNGKEVTRVYFYIYVSKKGNTTVALPDPLAETYLKSFNNHGIALSLFLGNPDDIDELKEYRFHYDLFVKGEVGSSDLEKFEMDIDKAWKTLYPEDFGSCRLCNTTVVRTEPYIGANGEMLTAIVYFFKIRMIWEMPLYRNPSVHELVSFINVTKTDNSSYDLYTGHLQYRYRHSYHVLIEGKADSNDDVAILNSVKGAWRNYSLLYAVSLSNRSVEYYSEDGQLITDIIFHVSYDHKEVDARLISHPSTSFMVDWFQNKHQVSRKGGALYVVHAKHSLQSLYWTGSLWDLYINGYVMVEDRSELEAIVEQAFITYYNVSSFSVKVIAENIYIQQSNSQVVSRLMLSVNKNGLRLSAHDIDSQTKTKMNQIIATSILSSKIKKYTLATISPWFDLDMKFQLYFTSKIATLDYTRLQSKVMSSLKSTWAEYAYFKGITNHFYQQEKVYRQNRTILWRISFFLMHSGNQVINPQFVTTISSPNLSVNLKFIGISKQEHKLYSGVSSKSWMFYRSAFTLTLDSSVSEYDWTKIKLSLAEEWCNRISGCTNRSSLSIWIAEQQTFVDKEGHFYYKMVYFIKHKNHWIDAKYYVPLVLKVDSFKWKNVYGLTYRIHTDSQTELWRYSYAFHLYTSMEVRYNTKEYTQLIESIKMAWYKVNASYVYNCSCLQIIGLPQVQLYTGSEKTIWQLTYFIRYKKDSHLVDSTVWPHLDVSLISFHFQSLHFIYNVDFWYYRHLLHFYSNFRVPLTSYKKLEHQMKEHWLKENTEFKSCGCIDVKIRSQEEVIDRDGHSHWMLHYHILKNGRPMKTSAVKPFNWATFKSNHTFSTVSGQKLQFEWSWEYFNSWVQYRHTGSLYLGSWVPSSLYGHFSSWLLSYYQRYFSGSNVTVTLTNKTKEFHSKEGGSVWQLPFLLTVNGTSVNPPPVNSTDFETTINATSPNGKPYKTTNKTDVTDTVLFFSVHFNHKVSEKVKANLSAALIGAFVEQHPGVDPDSLNVTFGKQEQVVNQKTKGESWQLSYTLSLNGTKLHKESTGNVNTTLFNKHLNLIGPNKIKYKAVDVDETYTSSHLFSLYFTSFVSTEDRKKVENSIKEAWEKEHTGSSDNVTVVFVRQKELLNSEGKSLWKWDYTLKLNSKVQRTAWVSHIAHEKLSEAVQKITSVTGKKYSLTDSFPTLYEYAKHFALYVSTKVKSTDFEFFKTELKKKWEQQGWNDTIVDVVRQEELVEKETGLSVWKLVYFLKKNGEVIDGRVTEHLKETSLPAVKGPHGNYKYRANMDLNKYLQYEWSGSIITSAKFGLKQRKELRDVIKKMVQNSITDVNLKKSVEVEINRHEEYQLNNGSRAWRVVYFIKLDGQYTEVKSLKSLNHTKLQQSLTFKNAHGETYTLYRSTDLAYRFRNKFTLHFTSEISSEHIEQIKEKILSTWSSSVLEYKNCNCLSIELLKEKATEEVIDEKWTPYWQLTYFLKKNGTVVESMMHIPVNLTHLNLELKSINSNKQRPYKVAAITEDKVKAISLMFSFQMNLIVGYTQRDDFLRAIQKTWIETNSDYFGKNISVKATINRMLRYIDVNGKKTVWQVDYSLHQSGVIVDPREVPILNLTQLNQRISFTHPTGQRYELMERSLETVQLRYKFQIFMDRRVRDIDLSKMAKAVEKYVNTEGIMEYQGNMSAVIPVQEGFVDFEGKLHWSMAVLLRTSAGVIIDSRSHANLNLTALQSHIDFTGVNNMSYTIQMKGPSRFRKYYQSFGVMVTNTVRQSDMLAVSNALINVWKETHSAGLYNSVLKVDIQRQEQYVSKRGLLTKLIYYITSDNVLVNGAQLSDVNTTRLNEELMTVNASQTYKIAKEERTFTYDSLFSLVLDGPVLRTDTATFEQQLAKAWRSKGNFTAEILAQEEQVLKTGKSATKVLYVLHKDQNQISAIEESAIKETEYKSWVVLNKTGTNRKYIDGLVKLDDVVSSYMDLYHIHIKSRVDTEDYRKLEAALMSLWNEKLIASLVSSVKILKQEILLKKSGEEVYQLLYSLTSQGRTITKRLEMGPTLMESVSLNITNKHGDYYMISGPTKTYRSSQVFRFLVNRQVYEADVTKFRTAISSSITSDITEVKKVTFELSSKKKVVSTKSSRVMWQYSFVVSSQQSSEMIEASLYPRIKASTVNTAIQFKSPRQEQYVIEVNNMAVSNYEDLFALDLKGHHSILKRNSIRAELVALWNSSYKDAKVHIPLMIPEEYINELGMAVTRYRYLLEVNTKPQYPSLIPTPDYMILARGVSLELHETGSLHKYSDCYKLVINRQLWSLDRTKVQKVIENAWNDGNKGKTNYTVAVVKQEDSVGRFGMSLSTVLYTVSQRSTETTKISTLTPDFAVEPSETDVQKMISSSNTSLVLYHSNTSKPYRLSSLYHVSITKNDTDKVLHKADLHTLQGLIQQAWTSIVTNIGPVKTTFMKSDKVAPVNESSTSVRLYYRVTSDDSSTFYESWERDVNIVQKLKKIFQGNSTFGSRYGVLDIPETQLRVLYIRGHYSMKNQQTVRQWIMKTWQQKITASTIAVKVHSMEKYSDAQWREVTKVEYKVTVNGSSPDNLQNAPGYDDLQRSLEAEGKTQCHCVAKKLRKEYVIKTGSALNTVRIKAAISSVWSGKNSVSSGITVSIRDRSSRGRRDTANDAPTTRLVGNDGKEIQPLEYSVSVDNQEPNPAFIDTPAPEDLATPLKQAGAEPCGCTPKIAGTVTVDGETKDSERPKLAEAVKDAFVKKNPGTNKADLDAAVDITNKKDAKGKPVSDIDYELTYRGGDVEDLDPPSKVDWQQSLSSAGKALHSRAPQVKKEEEDTSWRLPVIIAVAVCAVIVILLIVCYIIYMRKRSQKENLLKRGDQVTMRNTFDKEHFSDSAAYDSPSIAYSNPQYDSTDTFKSV